MPTINLHYKDGRVEKAKINNHAVLVFDYDENGSMKNAFEIRENSHENDYDEIDIIDDNPNFPKSNEYAEALERIWFPKTE